MSTTHLRRPILLAVTAATSSTTCYYYLNHTESGRGLGRQALFWSQLTPVVADYFWYTSSHSPYVRYYTTTTTTTNDDDDEGKSSSSSTKKKENLEYLHTKHAKTVFDVMLQLKGLYVKLGQVLSVTALPIPEPYRVLFRTLQSNVPGHEPFDVIRGAVERDLGRPIEEVFSEFCETPLGAASIGQAHLAKLDGQDVVVKVQYPDAGWQVPADIQCIRGIMRICIAAGVVDESSADLSFQEFSRQFLAELDYARETENLQETYRSSLDPDSPYRRHNVVVPEPFPEFCGERMITMSYLPGPKLEEEARRQLKALGIDLSSSRSGIRNVVASEEDRENEGSTVPAFSDASESRATNFIRWIGNSIGVDSVLWLARTVKKVMLASSGIVAYCVRSFAVVSPVPTSLQQWAESHVISYEQSRKVSATEDWIRALFDVHGFQVFQVGLFNADPHPGNILVVEEPDGSPKLGLIDFGQCKRLDSKDQADIARLIIAVADNKSDRDIADAFRNLGIKTKNDSSEHLAKLALLMFGPLKPYHLDRRWHEEMHEEDRVTYFPNSLGLVYRTTMLLRGLSLSLQINTSVADEWREHAEKALALDEKHDALHRGRERVVVLEEVPTRTSTLP